MSIYRSAEGREAVRRWCVEELAAWQVPHECRVFQAGGAETHAVVAGSGGPTVVVVPGTNFNAAACLPLATALATRYRTVLVDVPGQPGLSSGERGLAEGRLDWYGAWLSDAIEACASGPVIVLGHSFGAAIALSSASPRPALVDWMTFVARHARSSGAPALARVPSRSVPRRVVTGEHDVFLPPRRLRAAVHRTLGVELGVVEGAGHLVIEEQTRPHCRSRRPPGRLNGRSGRAATPGHRADEQPFPPHPLAPAPPPQHIRSRRFHEGRAPVEPTVELGRRPSS
ncbi:alpha/beta hydrolase [Streptomyces zaomyceticus]|uniref:alpha/beta fold hydrolase n=1 Tax=Streptomyces zaomyceticus TaxID=68286 RepID=UPI00324B12C6